MGPRRVVRSFSVLLVGVGLAGGCGGSNTSSSDDGGSSSGGTPGDSSGSGGGTSSSGSSSGFGGSSSAGGRRDGGGGDGSAGSGSGGSTGSSGSAGSDGGSESGAGTSCGKVSPCGGDLVGTWLIIDSCAGGIVIDPLGSCSGTTPTIQVTSFRNTGSLTFNADMTFQEAQTQSLTEAFQIPSTCLQETCDQYATGWKNVGDTANCTSSSAGCSCTWGQTQTTTESGIYRTSVTMFAVETEGGAGGTTEYCVQGTMLHLLSPAGGSDYDVVAQKQ